MKKLTIMALAAAGLLFGACASDDDVVVDDGQEQVWNTNGKGYLSVSINLPSVPTSRAANDNFDDGTPDEYKVNNALLLLFHNATTDDTYGTDAKFLSFHKLTLPARVKDADADNITTSYQVTTEITSEVKNNLFALVLLNYDQVIDATEFAKETPVLKFTGATPLTVGSTTTIVDLQKHVSSATFYTAKDGEKPATNFFMTNAVLSTNQGGSVGTPAAKKLFTLTKLNTENIKPTKEEAEKASTGSVYVERAVAKATLSTDETTVVNSNSENAIKSIEWNIDNMEPNSQLVRYMGETPSYIAYSSEAFSTAYYRMVGTVQMGTTAIQPAEAFYRTYWCVDPQYNTDEPTMTAASSYVATTEPLYCHENTFNVAHQNYRNTTRANLKVTINNGSTFYTINDADAMSTTEGINTALANVVIENSDIKKLFKDNYKGSGDYTIKAADFKITLNDVNSEGIKTVNTVEFSDDMKSAITTGTNFNNTMTFLTGDDLTDLIASMNASVKIKEFTGGVMYYEARFQHFANTYHESTYTGEWDATKQTAAISAADYAPWNIWETTKPSASTAYPAGSTKTAEENYLGRYGMVRNNWYDVKVTKFNKYGDPVPTSVTISNTPDDDIKQYISLKINVLSWAKRTQSWVF